MTRPGKALALILPLILPILPVRASAQSDAHLHVVVVIADALRFEDIKNPECGALLQMAQTSSAGMMNCAVAGARSGDAAILTLASGRQVASEAADGMAFNDWEAVPGEDGEARIVYMRRVGPLDPHIELKTPDAAHAVKHLGLPSLTRRALAEDRLGALLTAGSSGIKTFVCGNADTYTPDRAGALLTVDSIGRGAGTVSLLRYDSSATFGLVDDPLALLQISMAAAEQYDFVVVQTGDLSRLEAARGYLNDQQFHARRDDALRRLNTLLAGLYDNAEAQGTDLILVSPRPVADAARSYAWDRLTPIFAYGPHFPPGLLTSATTRQPGLVANIDFAPTMLALYGAAIPSVMDGRPMRTVSQNVEQGHNLATLDRLDYVSGLNQASQQKLFVPLGAFCFLIAACALVARRYGTRASHWFLPGFVFVLNIPAAMLLAPILVPPTVAEYGMRIGAWAVALTFISYLPSLRWRIRPVTTAMTVTALLIIADTLTGQTLQKSSAFSAYAVSGIRYYGIGNEYLAVLIVFSIMLVFSALDDLNVSLLPGTARRWVAPAAVIWAAVALMCGWPHIGANAGSLVVSCTVYGYALVALTGGRLKARLWLPLAALGLALAFAFGFMDSALNGANSSHSGAAIMAAAHGRGALYLAEIAYRKVMLNLQYLTTFGMMAGLAAIMAALWMATKLTGTALKQAIAGRNWLARSVYPLCAAGLSTLLFKDSGVVMFDYMAGAFTAVLLSRVIAAE